MTGKTNCQNRFTRAVICVLLVILFPSYLLSQKDHTPVTVESKYKARRIIYGQASFYANKFNGRQTATGEIFNQDKFTAACNVLPLGTWIQVTNLKNGKIIIVRTNDRLHAKTSRILDLTKAGAKKLGYVKRGLTRVKIEVLDQKKFRKLSN